MPREDPQTKIQPTEAGDLCAAVDATLDQLEKQKVPQRLWDRDPSLSKNDPAPGSIPGRLAFTREQAAACRSAAS